MKIGDDLSSYKFIVESSSGLNSGVICTSWRLEKDSQLADIDIAISGIKAYKVALHKSGFMYAGCVSASLSDFNMQKEERTKLNRQIIFTDSAPKPFYKMIFPIARLKYSVNESTDKRIIGNPDDVVLIAWSKIINTRGRNFGIDIFNDGFSTSELLREQVDKDNVLIITQTIIPSSYKPFEEIIRLADDLVDGKTPIVYKDFVSSRKKGYSKTHTLRDNVQFPKLFKLGSGLSGGYTAHLPDEQGGIISVYQAGSG